MTKISVLCAVGTILFIVVSAKTEIYQYRDKDGVLHFTDSAVGVPADKKPEIYNEIRGNERSGGKKDDLIEAGNAYLEKDFKKAILYYTRIFEAEKKNPTLSPKESRVVVDNLGMSYKAIGKYEKAEEIFKYGIKKDHEYPMFYYNLARTYAEMDNFPKIISNLRKAYENKKNMSPGERLPDPAKDTSFKRFMKREVFRRLVEEIKK